MPTMNDYERRFQRSLQKLTIPSWYIESNKSTSSKQSLVSTTPSLPWKNQNLDIERTPEIVHVRRPFSYRSCRSSLATSPSPSIHSWHPNHLTDGINLSLLLPSRSSSAAARRNQKHEKSIDRVTKSSRWYKPTVFTSNSNNVLTKDQTIIEKRNNHYDTPKINCHHVDEINSDTMVNEKQQETTIESSLMPLANQNEETIDDLERTANDLVESILSEILTYKTLEEIDDQNTGVRELTDDENSLRELDENDINNTDEFILFATQSDEPQINQNKFYTFAKIHEQNLSNDVETTNTSSEQIFFTSPIYQTNEFSNIKCPSIEGVNEETARIGRLLLNQIPISLFENLRHLSSNRTRPILFEQNDHYKSPTINECDEDIISDNAHIDSAYSSNQERIHLAQSIYEPLSECYSGYSYVQNDFLPTNLSSIQTTITTDEAYESEPTTMCSSIATTTHVHPDLEHEFEYPSPPPPVPDRRLKPSHLKPQSTKQENLASTEYSVIQKIKPLENLLNSTCNEPISPSTRSMSSRHYCGSIPIANENIQSTMIESNQNHKEKIKEKRHGRTLSCLHPSTTDETKRYNSFNKTKPKKQKNKNDFDEATNGLAIRLPATHAKPSPKRANSMMTNRPSYYETSV